MDTVKLPAGSVRGDVVDRWKRLRETAYDFAPSCFHGGTILEAEALVTL
jgi:hypothetical protein